MLKYRYTDTELKKLLSTLTIIVDTREQQNQHVLDYFDKKKIPYITQKCDTGDYSAMLPKNEELGIQRDMYISAAIERKNSVDELASSIKDRNRFENELIRSQKLKFCLVVEDANGYEGVLPTKRGYYTLSDFSHKKSRFPVR